MSALPWTLTLTPRAMLATFLTLRAIMVTLEQPLREVVAGVRWVTRGEGATRGKGVILTGEKERKGEEEVATMVIDMEMGEVKVM